MPCLFVSSPNNLKLQEETVCKIRNKSFAIGNGTSTLLEKIHPFRKQKASLIIAFISIVIVIIVIVIVSFFSGWNIWQLDGGELCQEPGPLAGGGDDDVEESAEDEDVDGDEDSDVDDVDDEDVDDNVLVEGEHNQLAPCQHLLLQPTHRIPGQGGSSCFVIVYWSILSGESCYCYCFSRRISLSPPYSSQSLRSMSAMLFQLESGK